MDPSKVIGTCSLCGGLVRSFVLGISCASCGALPDLPVIPMRRDVAPTYVPVQPLTVPIWPPIGDPHWGGGTITVTGTVETIG